MTTAFGHATDHILNEKGVRLGAKAEATALGAIAISSGEGPAVASAAEACQIGEGTNADASTLQFRDKKVPLVSDGDMAAGTGITTGTGTVVTYEVENTGVFIKTRIYLDITGLSDGGAANDIIGKTGGTANCHIGQILAAVNGTIVAGTMTCLELPVGGDVDIDLYGSVDEATGAQDAAIGDLTGEAKLVDSGDWTLGASKAFALLPDPDGYMYLACGDTTGAPYTAGKFLIEMIGTPA
jgi:hypothetical protein